MPGVSSRGSRGPWLRRLPKKDNPRRGLWLANCQRLDPSGQGLWDPASEYIYFCSKHFEENCFELVGIRCVPRGGRAAWPGGPRAGVHPGLPLPLPALPGSGKEPLPSSAHPARPAIHR